MCHNKAKLVTHLDFQNLFSVYIIIASFVTFDISDAIFFSVKTFNLYNVLYVLMIDCIACADGTYGLECNELCGHCKIKTNCHHTNGTCLGGCEPGFLGDLCKTCKSININS